jgi:hypothetical protein
MAAVGNVLGALFLVGFTAFSGFCFVFGIAFTLLVLVLTVLAAIENGVIAGGVFWAIFPPVIVAFEYVSWRFFWFGLSFLRGGRSTEEARG